MGDFLTGELSGAFGKFVDENQADKSAPTVSPGISECTPKTYFER